MVNPCKFYDYYLKRYIRHRHLCSIVGNATALRLSSFFMEGFLQLGFIERTEVVPFKRFGVRLRKSSDLYLQSDCLVFTSDIRLRVFAT